MIRDFTKHGELSPESIEKIDSLMDGGIEHIQWLVGFIRVMPHLPEKSAELRDQHKEIANTARKLAALIEADLLHALNHLREIRQIIDYYDFTADQSDPRGKPQPRNAGHYALAYYLVCDAVLYGRLDIEPKIHNDSDFAELYRICCKEAGLAVRKNVAPYLSNAIDKANDELIIRKRQKRIKRLSRIPTQRMLRDNFQHNK